MGRVLQTIEPLSRPILQRYWRWTRGLTLGVRGLVIDAERKVFLITHTYAKGWHLPGGGVEPGETLNEALSRELVEEGNIEILAPPVLHGMFFNDRVSRRDHVALYVVENFRQAKPPQPDWEISAHGFFAVDALPEGTTRGTMARIVEVMSGAPRSEYW